KLVHVAMKVKRASIAAAGRAAGSPMYQNVWNIDAPSTRPASTSSSGRAWFRYWVIQNTPNAVTSAGTITAPSEPAQPRLDLTMKSGTTPSCVGTAMVAMTNTSRPRLPRNRSFANEYPARVEKKTTDADTTVETMMLLPRARQKCTDWLLMTVMALSMKLPPGIQL